MSSLDPSSPAFTSMARRRSAPERILSIEGPAQDHYYTSCRLDVRGAARLVGETRLGAGGFEQLNGVAGGVVDHDLLAADAGDQLSAQMDAGAEPVHGAGQIGDFDGEPIPPSRCG